MNADNRLLLQVFFLKEEGGKSWKETEQFFHKILDQEDIPPSRMRTLTDATVRKVKKLTHQVDVTPFLNFKIDIDNLGTHLTQAGLTRKSLLD